MIVKLNNKPRVYRFRIFLFVDTYDNLESPNRCPKRIIRKELKEYLNGEYPYSVKIDYFDNTFDSYMILEKICYIDEDIGKHLENLENIVMSIMNIHNDTSLDYDIRIKRIVFDSYGSGTPDSFYQDEITKDIEKMICISKRLEYKKFRNIFNEHDYKHIITFLPDNGWNKENDNIINDFDFDRSSTIKKEFFDIILKSKNMESISRSILLNF